MSAKPWCSLFEAQVGRSQNEGANEIGRKKELRDAGAFPSHYAHAANVYERCIVGVVVDRFMRRSHGGGHVR